VQEGTLNRTFTYSFRILLFTAVATLFALGADESAITRFDATLEKDIHAKRVKVGDNVSARVKTPFALKDGTKIPKNSKLVGHVTEVNQKADQSGPSTIGLLFDKVLLGKDEEKPVAITLISVAPPQEQRGVNELASQSGMSGAGRISSLSSSTGRGSTAESSENVLKSGLGANSGGVADPELRAGISGIENVSITYKSSGPDTLFQNSKESVYLQRWSRLLFQVN
jgi:hypothetical protein